MALRVRALALALVATIARAACVIPPKRPAPSDRTFVSPVIDSAIAALVPRFLDVNMATLFANTLPNALDTTILLHNSSAGAEDTFLVTGDIPAMWLRDSTNQVWPYLRYAPQDPALRSLLRGLIRRQVYNVLHAPYANAFQLNASTPGEHASDVVFPADLKSNLVFEAKWESDSLSNVLRLASAYYNATADASPFDTDFVAAVRLILATFRQQQLGSDAEDAAGGAAYSFQRDTPEPSDSLEHGRGPPAASGTGLIKCGFRGSDDALLLPFNIAENAFAASALTSASALLSALGLDADAASAASLSQEVRAGIAAYGVMRHSITKTDVWAYEVDGYGNQVFMDDANIPGLLSMPYYGFAQSDDPLYVSTRAALLSSVNPYWISGSAGAAIGGPHNGRPWVWPMSMSTRAWTSDDPAEIAQQLAWLLNSSACTGFIHESFMKDDVTTFTRPWFAWANSQFGDLILKVIDEHPELLLKAET